MKSASSRATATQHLFCVILRPALSLRAILIEGDLLGGQLELDAGEMAFVGRSPGRFALISASMAQQHRFELQSGAQSRGAGILSSASEVTDSLIALIGHDDSHEVASARLPSEQQRIEPIGLDQLLRGFACDVGRRDHLASPSLRAQIAPSRSRMGPPRTRTHKSAGPQTVGPDMMSRCRVLERGARGAMWGRA